jgi:hypothetical protein
VRIDDLLKNLLETPSAPFGGLVLGAAYAQNAGANAKHGEYASVEAMLLAEGTHYAGAKKWVPRCGWRMGPQTKCYQNSLRLSSSRYYYCEGVALSGQGHVIAHAWVEDSIDGLAIDRTLREPSTEYLGFRFSAECVYEAIGENRSFSVLSCPNLVRRLLSEPEFRAKAFVQKSADAAAVAP